MKAPKIRFKGFEGDWEEKKIDNICNRFDNLRIPISAKNRIPGSIPYYWANGIQDYIDWYTHNWEFLLIAEDWANDLKDYPIQYVKWKIWVNNHAHVLQWKQELSNNIFLKYAIKHTNIESLLVWWWRAKLNASVLMWIDISLPSLPEQEKIWALFEQLDSHISKNQQKLEKLKNMKQSFLQKLFPKDWSALPELRFKGFEGAWEERKLGELFEERHEVSTITEDYPQLSFSIAEWVIKPEDRKTNKRDFLIIDKTNKKYLKTELDDIIYNPSNIVFWAIHRNWLCKWVVSPIYKIFSTQQDSIFMDSLVTRKIFINETKKFLEWTVTKLRSLKPEAFLNIKVLISSEIKEQRRIWQLFNVIDKQIKLYEPQIQKLQNLKQSLLEKMFI